MRLPALSPENPERYKLILNSIYGKFGTKKITELKESSSVCRELVLVKVAANSEQRQQIIAIADVFRAKIVDVAPGSLMVELTGSQTKLDAFVGLLEGFNILELVRTGITGLKRGIVD